MSSSPINAATFRHPRNLAAARLTELASPILKVAAVLSSPGSPDSTSSRRRGILVGADHIGDVLYNTASLSALAEAFPDCENGIMWPPPASEILANNPHIKSWVRSPKTLGRIDVAICYNSGGYWRDLINVTRWRIPNRVGYVHTGSRPRHLSDPDQLSTAIPGVAPRPGRATCQAGKAHGSVRPRIYPSPEDAARGGCSLE